MKISYAHIKILDTVHIWYCLNLVKLTYMEVNKDMHVQIGVDTKRENLCLISLNVQYSSKKNRTYRHLL